MKAVKLSLLVTALISSFVLCFGSYSWGDDYTRGRHTCDGFAEAERLHKSKPQSITYEMVYGVCLSLRGRGNDAAEGLSRLRRIAKQHNHIVAALFIAEFIESGGDFQVPIDLDKVNEAIHAYGRVLTYINFDPRYPLGEPINYFIWEKYHQMELRSYYHIPYLYLNKFAAGFHGLYHEYLLTSPSYKGKRDLPRFHKYSSYTQDSLEKAIESANRCLALPKKRHFKTKHYEYYQKLCRLIKETTMAIQPLEDKRLILLATESCRRDLPKCREYDVLHKQISDIIKKYSPKSEALSKAYNIGLL